LLNTDGYSVPDSFGAVSHDPTVSAAKLQILDYEKNITTIALSQALTISSPATISFDVKFDNGSTRNLGLDADGNPIAAGQPNYFQASIDYNFLMAFDKAGPYDINYEPIILKDIGQGWFRFTQNLYSSGTLSFELYDRSDAFSSTAWIDNVVLTENVAPVPEPSTMLLLGAGIAGLAFSRRRKV
jgi:hypothetical protein